MQLQLEFFAQGGILDSGQIGVQSVAIPQMNDLLKDRNHDGPELHERFRRPQPHQAVRIGQPFQQRGYRARIGKAPYSDDCAQPDKPGAVFRQLIERVKSHSCIRMGQRARCRSPQFFAFIADEL